jgi:hypothetical protein
MTLAELLLFAAAACALYLLLRPIQRRLERYLTSRITGRPRPTHPTIDVTDFKSYAVRKKDDDPT